MSKKGERRERQMANAPVENGDRLQHNWPLGRKRNIVVVGRVGGQLCLFLAPYYLNSLLPYHHADSETLQPQRVLYVMEQIVNHTTEK